MHTTPLDKKLALLTSDKLLKWIAIIGAIATTVLVGSFFVYWNFFNTHKISNDPSDWGTFGDFIGGVTNPIISFFSLTALLLTLVLQAKQLDAAREELRQALASSREQTENIKRETRKTDVHRTLQVLEDRLESLYREPIYIPLNNELEKWELYLLFSHAGPRVLEAIPTLHDLGPQKHRNEYLSTKATLTQLHVTLVKLSTQLTLLVNIDNSDEFTFFYEPTLAYFAKKLGAVGYLPADDAQTIQIGQKMRQQMSRSRQTQNTQHFT